MRLGTGVVETAEALVPGAWVESTHLFSEYFSCGYYVLIAILTARGKKVQTSDSVNLLSQLGQVTMTNMPQTGQPEQ